MTDEKQGKKWYTSRTLWAAALIFAGTIAEAVLSGGLTRVTAVGIVSGAAMVLLRTLTSEGILWGAILAVGLGVSGCGTTTAQKMTLVGQGTAIAWARGYPLIDATCKTEAQKCVKPGEAVPLAECPGASKCLAALKSFQRGLDTADRAVMVSLPLAAADSPGAAEYLAAALRAYEQAMQAAAAWGLAPGGVK